MGQIENTVFLSYRRTNAAWALAIFHSLSRHKLDVFFDFTGLASGDFERVILANIRARAHFLVLLTPSALERCHEPGDYFRLEIETAIEEKRNIVPLMLEGFEFNSPGISQQLTGRLAVLKHYGALRVPVEFFDEAMNRLYEKYMSVPLDAVLHPVSAFAEEAAKSEQAEARMAPVTTKEELTAEEGIERGLKETGSKKKQKNISKAIRLKPDQAYAFLERGISRNADGDVSGALQDYTAAIRIKPEYAAAFYHRGTARQQIGDLKGAICDYDDSLRLDKGDAITYRGRGTARQASGDLEGAIQDYNESLRLNPNEGFTYYCRSTARIKSGDLHGALEDCDRAIQMQPDLMDAYWSRGLAYWRGKKYTEAAVEFRIFLNLGGGRKHGNTKAIEDCIRFAEKQR